MAALHQSLGLFTRYNVITGYIDSARKHYQVVLVGEPLPQEAINLPVAAQAFGFDYIFYGCVVSGPAQNGISGYNKVMARALAEINGPGWEQKLLETIKQLNEE